MYYELYADSLWLLNFVMNLYLLILVDRRLLRTAARVRLVLGAAVGAAVYLLPFLWDAPALLKYLAGIITGSAAMICIAFRPRGMRAFIRILETLFQYCFLVGGLLLFLTGSIPFFRKRVVNVCGILGLGALGFLGATYLQDRRNAARRNSSCKATLVRNGSRISVTALIDSGNSLVEPISGKPVSVIDETLYQALWQEEEAPCRVVPYSSIGKERGMLRAYLLPELRIEADGMEKSLENVYVAVSREYTGEVRMILNPTVLEYAPDSRKKNKWEKRSMG